MKKTLLISLVCASLIAQESFTLKEQTVTATHLEQDELSYAAPIEIYTDEDIQASKSKNIYDFLNQETSVTTSQAYGSPFSQKIDMRGYGVDNGYENIVVIVNGRRLNNIDRVPQLLASIPIDSIEKIEILKGAGSVEYGDGANAGVINITTKEYNGASIKTYAGNFGIVYGSFGAGYKGKKFSLSTFGDYYESDGQRSLYTGDKDDSSRLKNGSFDLKVYPLEELELHLGYAVTRSKVNYAGILTQAQYKDDPSQATLSAGGDSLQYYDTDIWSFGFSYELDTQWSIDANVNLEDKDSDYRSLYYDNKLDYAYNSGEISTNYQDEDLKISVGISMYDGKRDSVANANTTTKENMAAFFKTNYTLDEHSITAGLRAEKVTYEYKPTSNANLKKDDTLEAYELGYNYQINKQSSVFTSYAHSFQTPNIDDSFVTIYDIFWNPVGTEFSTFIDPMKADTFNIGYNNFSTNNKLKLTLFYADIKNEIYFNPSTWENTNLDETSKLGLEIYNKYLIHENLYISANYTYIDAKIDKEDSQSIKDKILPGVSKHNLIANMGYAPSQGSKIIASHTYRSSAYAIEDFQNTFSQKQEAYHSTDLAFSYFVNDNFEVFAKIQNIFDEDNAIWVRNDGVYPSNFQRAFQIGLSGNF